MTWEQDIRRMEIIGNVGFISTPFMAQGYRMREAVLLSTGITVGPCLGVNYGISAGLQEIDNCPDAAILHGR